MRKGSRMGWWVSRLLGGVSLCCFVVLAPLVAEAAPSSSGTSPSCSVESINHQVSELYRERMQDFLADGPSATELLLKRGLLGKNLEQLILDDDLLSSCNPGNLYCVDRDLLLGRQDYPKDATHTVDTRKTDQRFEARVRGMSHGKVVLVRRLQISCVTAPKIEDFLDRAGGSELKTLGACARNEHDPAELARCRTEQEFIKD